MQSDAPPRFEQHVRTSYSSDGRVCTQTVLVELSSPIYHVHEGHEVDNEFYRTVLSETVIASSDCTDPVTYQEWAVGHAERKQASADTQSAAKAARVASGDALAAALREMATMVGISNGGALLGQIGKGD